MSKYFIAASIICLLFCNDNAIAQDSKYRVTAIGFYNMENLFDTINDPGNKGDDEFTPTGDYHYTGEMYKQKLHNLAVVLQQLGSSVKSGPAIIGCAEVENRKVLEDLVSQPEIKERNYKIVHFDSPDERGIDVALLYNPAYFKVLNAKAYPVMISGTGGKENTRDILYVAGVLAGDTIHLLVNHWPSRRGGEKETENKRVAAAYSNKRIIDSLFGTNQSVKIILMGDLNDNPLDSSVMIVADAMKNNDEIGAMHLYNPFIEIYLRGNGTTKYNGRWNLFDQVLLSPTGSSKSKSCWHYLKAEIFNKDFLTIKSGKLKGYPYRSFEGTYWINGYSDHYPVLLYLKR